MVKLVMIWWWFSFQPQYTTDDSQEVYSHGESSWVRTASYAEQEAKFDAHKKLEDLCTQKYAAKAELQWVQYYSLTTRTDTDMSSVTTLFAAEIDARAVCLERED